MIVQLFVFFVCQDISDSNLMVGLLKMGHDAQSESENAFIPEVIDLEKNKEKPGEPFI